MPNLDNMGIMDYMAHVSVQMSFSKITQVFHRTVFPIHFVTPRVQRLRSPRSDLFQVSFSRTYTPAYWELYEENCRLKRERAEVFDGYNKFKALQKEKQQPPWEPSPKKQRIMTQGTATLFAGKIIPSSWGHFDEIVNRGYTFIDKTSLITEFIECASGVSLVVRPRRFGTVQRYKNYGEIMSTPSTKSVDRTPKKNKKVRAQEHKTREINDFSKEDVEVPPNYGSSNDFEEMKF
ncbi:3403_t:CDS:2 [Scutellospora calospora]|uniref:3403_t:CDS:1 n=1 Tax=Scutellospora calospora TaxID=85575 RepID=A0ACA9LRX7_9GLOM|nr:3403_t:CDS:2 [Scutellospora calospora]